ncbi:MAG: hypothetical protein Kow0047_24740 [Anaerolineae bacterium]
MRRLIFLGLAWLWASTQTVALAHSGAPYPIVLDEPAGPYRVTVLADPDVGNGTFEITVTLASEEPAPEGTEVELYLQPVDGHAAAQIYPAQRRADDEAFRASVPFDAEGEWTGQLIVRGPEGEAQLPLLVRVTPPGRGWVTSLLCLLPFIIIGLAWGVAATRRRTR